MNPTRGDHFAIWLKKFLPALTAVLACAYFTWAAWPVSDPPKGFHFHKFGYLPVIADGRYKPMQTVAATSLMVITHGKDFYDSQAKKTYPGVKWLLDTQIGDSDSYDVFRIENDQVLGFLHLKRRPGLRYSFAEILNGQDPENHPQGNAKAFDLALEQIRAKDPKKLTLFEGKLFELSQHLQVQTRLARHAAPLTIPDPDGSDQWTTVSDAFGKFRDARPEELHGIDAETFLVYKRLLQDYSQGDAGVVDFNQTLSKHLAELRKSDQVDMRKIAVEVFFNDFSPFLQCLMWYAAIAVIGLAGWAIPDDSWRRAVHRSCYVAMFVTFLVHLSGFFIRMYLQDRLFVFVTNLYSAAVFIGLGSAAFCLICEAIYRNSIALIVGSIGGFLTLIIAHMLSFSSDTLEMMQAVLDTNFWLATHVTIITLGYVSAFVGGLMGCAYIFLGIFTNALRKDGAANLNRMTYGVLCAGMFLSFVGTVLGGLWADYSWGRFWGWDPKENGALLIVLWIALILHARWGGMVKQRGMAVLSVLSIVVTSWSMFGTNFLGVGLHSYGFRQGAMATLMLFDLLIIAIAGLGMIPLDMWQSFRPLPQPEQPTLTPTRPRPVNV